MPDDPESTKPVILRIRNRPWFQTLSVIGVFLAIPAFVLGFAPVQNSLFHRQPVLEIVLVNQTSVFDVRRPINGLVVQYFGKDLTAARQDVVVSTLRVINSGSDSITPDRVSPIDPVGFEVLGGRVLRVSGFSATTDHLRRNASPRLTNNDIFLNHQIILDPGDSITVDLLVLRGQSDTLQYRPRGKIAGIDRIQFVDRQDATRRPGLVVETFRGSPWAQIIRLIAYSVVALTLFGIVVGAWGALQAFRIRRRREKERAVLEGWNRVAEFPEQLKVLAIATATYLGTENLCAFANAIQEVKVVDSLTDADLRWRDSFASASDAETEDRIIKYYERRYIKARVVLSVAATLGYYGVSSRTLTKPLLDVFLSLAQFLETADGARALKGTVPASEQAMFTKSLDAPTEF